MISNKKHIEAQYAGNGRYRSCIYEYDRSHRRLLWASDKTHTKVDAIDEAKEYAISQGWNYDIGFCV